MDLIRALEELSLEVKSKEGQAGARPDTDGYSVQSLQDDHTGDRLQQMLEFDSSLKTLLVQLNDLHSTQPGNLQTGATKQSAAKEDVQSLEELANRQPLYRHHQGFSNWWSRACRKGGSLETSQEDEDSDCSLSLGSEPVPPKSRQMNPLVRGLLAKDLSSITETVRKIGRILALGEAIENMCQKLKEYGLHNTSLQQPRPDAHNYLQDLTYGMSMCNLFQDLCTDDCDIMNISTILHYKDCCRKLLAQIELLDMRTKKLESIKEFTHETHHHCPDKQLIPPPASPIVHMEEDVATFDADDKTWTENKLYVAQ